MAGLPYGHSACLMTGFFQNSLYQKGGHYLCRYHLWNENNRQRVFKKAAWYVEKSTRFDNQETWVSSPDLPVLEFGRVGRDQQPVAFKALFSSWTLSCALGHDRVGSEFLNKLFGNSVEGGLKEKHWIGGKEVVRV